MLCFTVASSEITYCHYLPFDLVIFRETVVVFVLPPPVPVMVMVYVPVLALLLAVNVTVDVPEPGAGMDVGLKLAVTPDGWPFADKATAELKPPETVVVIFDVPLLPWAADTEVGEAEMVKLGVGAAVTVRLTVDVCVTPPPVPVTVIVYVPVAVVGATAKVSVEVPEPGAAMGLGLKVAVTPVGWPDADKATAELKPFKTALVIVDEPLFPCITETEAGEGERVKLGDVGAPTSALIRLAPFILPQPVTKS